MNSTHTDIIIASMDRFEKQQMLNCWQAAQNCANDYNKKRSFIYWDDLERTMKELRNDGFIPEQSDFDYIMQELEQKMYYKFEEKELETE